ncbi:MAG: hypothetical protein PHT00_02535 [Candidatus Methanomethylophilus sp.]|nr:hypothetical protein [Methanomethylophilus sp.]MDD3233031.1 hypothetical protein [Methanomethylophilus sp.]MDD4222283.1 hypothetical protein [Methanomethylophilus sp.]MDD4668872.1 hypothetical protein [Methanomethylophilus sp.]
MATVIVKMKTCDKTHKITVTATEDGNYAVKIASDCPKIAAYGKRLSVITLDDIIDFPKSRIVAGDVRQDISSNCLAPIGVINAGWLEAGLMTKTLAKKSVDNEIRFVDDSGEILP